MRVLIVDDSAFMRKALSQIVGSDPALEVVGTAQNGRAGVEKALGLRPDIVTLDIEMPEMDGLEALRQILAGSAEPKPAVVICSSLTPKGSAMSLRAMGLGAADVIAKPGASISLDIARIGDDLVARLKAIGQSRAMRIARAASRAPLPSSRRLALASHDVDAIVIGSSTGGPPVIEEILTALPPGVPPIVIAQHMPSLFTQSMSERLSAQCGYAVEHLTGAREARRGRAYICEGGRHVRLSLTDGRPWAAPHAEPTGALYKPSASVLFSSAAKALGRRCLAVVLTGMGEDGAEGARDMRDASAPVVAQSEDTCVVYGMPRAVVQRGLACAVMSPVDIRALIASLGVSSDKLSA